LDILWAPWRQAYVRGEKPAGCFICEIARQQNDAQNFVLWRASLSLILLNRFPYNSGHLMVCPVRHAASLSDLTSAERYELQDGLCHCQRALSDIYKPDGFNIGVNLGAAAGAGLADHLHWHILPRWTGDSNFMSSIAELRVLSQSLDASFQLLGPALRSSIIQGLDSA